LRSAAAVSAGMSLEIEFSDGRVGARAEGGPVIEAPSVLTKPRGRRGSSSGQGDLF
jgi:hypothetical protein